MHAKIYIPCEGVVNRVYSLQEDRMHKTVDDEVIFVFYEWRDRKSRQRQPTWLGESLLTHSILYIEWR